MQTSILRLPKVKEKTGLSRSTIYAKVRDGSFVAPVQLSARAVGWREADINAWLESRVTRGVAA